MVFDKLKLRANQTLVNLKTENYVRAYAETMEALKFDVDGPKIQCKVFEDHFHFFRSYFNTEGQCLNALS